MKTILAALMGLACVAASAAEYQLQLYETRAELAKRTDTSPAGAAYWQAYAAFGEALKTAGVLRGGAALRAAGESRTLAGPDGSLVPATPPYAGTELGGYFVIEAASIDAARAWAARSPAALTGGVVEVRPLFPVPGMSR